MEKRLFVGNIPYAATEEELRELCEPFGKLAEVQIPFDRESGRSKGFAFVEFVTDTEARAARDALDGTTVKGRPLRVDFARPRERARTA